MSARGGDRLAALHDQLAVDLLGYFVRRVESREDAADLLAETFIVAWRRIRQLPDDDERARMWMFVTARNVYRNHERGRLRRRRLADRLRLDLATPVGAHPDSHSPEALATRLDVRAAIRSLPMDQRELVMLVHWEGFSVAEACRIIGVREPTARGRYQRARATLRVLLGPAAHEGVDAVGRGAGDGCSAGHGDG